MNLLSDRVAEAINTSGIDVAEIARSCGISVQAVYKWMNGGSKTISGIHLVELARLTGFEARWIISGKGLKQRDPKAMAVCEAMQTMPEYKKDVLVSTSSALAEPEKHNGTDGSH